MTNTISLQDAEQRLTAATATVDQLKAKILDQGPGSVTAEELGQAALDVEHARLAVAHAAKVAEENAAAERHDQLQLLKAQILRDAGDVDTALDAMRQIEAATALLVQTCTGRQTLVSHATAAMRRAGVPQGSTSADEHAGLGWTTAGMGRSDEVYVDGRRITSINPALLIAAALQRGTQRAGRSTNHLAPVINLGGQAVIGDPEDWLRRRF